MTADNVIPLRHRPRLKHCDTCDAFIAAQWGLALRGEYAEREAAGSDELEPRMNTRWDDVEENEPRGLL